MAVSRSDNEEEYFARIEFEKRRKILEDQQLALEDAERVRLKELHHMRCPKCGMELQEIELRGVKVDKCFGCEGIWLDAGELEILSKLDKPASDRLLSLFRRE